MPLYAILVEDNPTIRDTLIPTLEELANIQVVAIAETAEQAIELGRQIPAAWRLMVLDLFLRDGSGLDVLEALAPLEAGHEVIVFTNYATPDVRERCLHLGANAVFDKSTEIDAFVDYCIDCFGDAS